MAPRVATTAITPLCISSAPILGPTDSVRRKSYLSPIVSSTSLIATCWHHSARWSGVMSMRAMLVLPRGSWRSWTVRPARLTASRQFAASSPAGAVNSTSPVLGGPGLTLQPSPARCFITRSALATHWALPSWRCTRISAVLASPNSCSDTSPRPRLPRVERSSSRWIVPCLARTWTAMPPSKSMPKLRPNTRAPTSDSTLIAVEIASAIRRLPRKSNLVWARMRWCGLHSMASASDRQFGGPPPAHPGGQQHAGEDGGGEQMGEQAERQRGGKAADRAGAETEQQDAGDQRGQIGIDDRGQRPLIAGGERAERRAAVLLLLAHALVDQHVGIDRHADGEHEARDAGQGERGAEDRHAG